MSVSFLAGIRVDLTRPKSVKKNIPAIAACWLLVSISSNTACAQTTEVVVQDLDKSFVAVPKRSEEATRFVKKAATPVVIRPAPAKPNTHNSSEKFTGTAFPIRISEPTTTKPSTKTNEK